MTFIQFNNITKRFPGVLALDRVSFGVQRGSCHAPMGGSGSTSGSLAIEARAS